MLTRRYSAISRELSGDATFLREIGVAAKQRVNDSGNEFLTKFPLFGMSSIIYKKHKDLLHQAFDMVARDLKRLHDDGVVVGGRKFFAATLGCKGDLKFHHQMGSLCRSYFNVGTKENHPICSLCLAGKEGLNFEDVSDRPPWMETMFQEKPWPEGQAPRLIQIPFEDSCPESFFRLDIFHTWKCGLGRDLTGSTLVCLLQLGYFDNDGEEEEYNFPARLERAFSSFKLWCLANQKSMAIHSFSRSLLNYTNERCFPWFNVKGSDNTLLTSWLLFFVKLSVQSFGHRHLDFERAIIETFESTTVIFDVLHSHPLWMSRACGIRVQHHLAVMVRGYKVLAQEARKLNLVAYGFKPKMHSLDHIGKDLKRQVQSGAPKVFNPMVFGCEANESVVGHLSRLSRRVSSRTVSHRVIDRICIKMKSEFGKYKAKAKLGKLRPRRKR